MVALWGCGYPCRTASPHHSSSLALYGSMTPAVIHFCLCQLSLLQWMMMRPEEKQGLLYWCQCSAGPCQCACHLSHKLQRYRIDLVQPPWPLATCPSHSLNAQTASLAAVTPLHSPWSEDICGVSYSSPPAMSAVKERMGQNELQTVYWVINSSWPILYTCSLDCQWSGRDTKK